MTQEKIRSMFNYDKETGIFTRVKKKRDRNKLRKFAGSLSNTGYIRIKINGKNYQAHRLALLYIDGEMPEFVDHINHNRSDNRYCNLRHVTRKENGQNANKSKANTTGSTGVVWNKKNRRWTANIGVDNKRIYLGSFANFSEAINARKLAEVTYGFHENHGKTL